LTDDNIRRFLLSELWLEGGCLEIWHTLWLFLFFLLTKQPRNAFYARHVLSLKEASFYSSLFLPHPKKNYNFQLDMKIRREKRTAF
jgi:hypothetical protein